MSHKIKKGVDNMEGLEKKCKKCGEYKNCSYCLDDKDCRDWYCFECWNKMMDRFINKF